MLDTRDFYNALLAEGLDFYTGVPDSLLSSFCACVSDHSPNRNNITAANEGNAAAIAAGYYLASGKYGVVYMQNSGIGNAVNPLLSLANDAVYSIPMLLLVGWRGQPGIKDEPQHKKQGEITLELFQTLGIETILLDENYKQQIKYCYNYMKTNNKPISLIVRKDTFSEYRFNIPKSKYKMTRETALECILNKLGNNDFIVSTTGKTSRELFDLREKRAEGHGNDFLTVGSMGHTASIAFGMSLGTDKNIWCVDGDGSFLMHTGGFAVIGQSIPENFHYILINNGAHESVGGQPTVAFDTDIPAALRSFGFQKVYIAENINKLDESITKLITEPYSALVIYTCQGSRNNLGRPTVSPLENKQHFMKKIGSIYESTDI